MRHDFAALDDFGFAFNDRRWRAMTNDECAVLGDGLGHLSCAKGAVIEGRRPRSCARQSAVIVASATGGAQPHG